MKKIITILMVVVLVCGGGFLVRQKKMRIAAAGVPKVRKTMVRTAIADRGDLLITRIYLGRIEPWRSVSLSPEISARVMKISVHEGDVVTRGQNLAMLDKEELVARVRAVKAGLTQSRMQAEAASATLLSLEKNFLFRKRELERDERLVKAGAIARVVAETSSDRLDEIKGRLDAMKKTVQAAKEQIKVREQELDQAVTRLNYAGITAPFDGVVARRLADPGDMAGPGQPLMQIEDHTKFKICFDIPQSELPWLKKGMEIMAGNDEKLHLAISRIHPSLNRDRTLTVECDTPAVQGLWAGSTLEVKAVLNSFKNATLLPETTLIPAPDGSSAVFIIEKGITAAIPVTVLGRNSGVAAVQGLEPGTRVIQNTYLGWNRLAAGEQVEVLP